MSVWKVMQEFVVVVPRKGTEDYNNLIECGLRREYFSHENLQEAGFDVRANLAELMVELYQECELDKWVIDPLVLVEPTDDNFELEVDDD